MFKAVGSQSTESIEKELQHNDDLDNEVRSLGTFYLWNKGNYVIHLEQSFPVVVMAPPSLTFFFWNYFLVPAAQ